MNSIKDQEDGLPDTSGFCLFISDAIVVCPAGVPCNFAFRSSKVTTQLRKVSSHAKTAGFDPPTLVALFNSANTFW